VKIKNKNIVSTLFEKIINIIEQSKHYAVTQVNYSFVIAYWNIGKMIKINIIESKLLRAISPERLWLSRLAFEKVL